MVTKRKSRGILSIILIFSVIWSVCAFPVSAALPTDILVDNFTGSNYDVGSAPSNSAGWYLSKSTDGLGTLSGTVNTMKVMQDTTYGTNGLILQNNSTTVNMGGYRTLGSNISLTSAGVVEIRFNMAIDAATQATGPGVLMLKIGSNAANDAGSCGYGFISQNGIGYTPAMSFKNSGGSGNSYFAGTGNTTIPTNKAVTPGAMYTFVGLIDYTSSGTVNMKMKTFPYGTTEPSTWDMAIKADGSYTSSSLGTALTNLMVYTYNNPQGTQAISDIQVRQYANRTDQSNSLKAYNDSLSLVDSTIKNTNNDLNSVTSDLYLPTTIGSNNSIITWTSSNTNYISSTGVVTRPTDADKTVYLTASVTNGTGVFTKMFKVTLPQNMSAEQVDIANDKAALTEAVIKGANTSLNYVTQNLTLPTNGNSGKTSIQWSVSPSQGYLTSNGTVSRPTAMDGDQQISLTATISENGYSDTKTFTVNLISASGVVAYDDFNYQDNTLVSSIGAEASKGFGSGWYIDDNCTISATSDFKIKSAPFGKAIWYAATGNGILYRKLNGGINFDANRDYYISWNQLMSGNFGPTYIVQKIEFDGASSPVALIAMNKMTPSISLTEMTPQIKIGANKLSGTDTFSTGDMLTVVAKISARASGNDTVYIKMFRCGTQEPKDWQLTLSDTVTGKANIMMLNSSPNVTGTDEYFGNIKIYAVNNPEDSGPITDAEAALATALTTRSPADITAATINIAALNESVVKTSLNNRLALFNPVVVWAPTFTQGGAIIPAIKATGDVTCTVKVDNNKVAPINCKLIVAVYKNGMLAKIGVSSDLDPSIAANSSKTYTATVNVADASSTLKAYVWEDATNIKPYGRVTYVDQKVIQ